MGGKGGAGKGSLFSIFRAKKDPVSLLMCPPHKSAFALLCVLLQTVLKNALALPPASFTRFATPTWQLAPAQHPCRSQGRLCSGSWLLLEMLSDRVPACQRFLFSRLLGRLQKPGEEGGPAPVPSIHPDEGTRRKKSP